MKRGKALKRDVRKTREWERRSREKQQREQRERQVRRAAEYIDGHGWRETQPQFRRGRIVGLRGFTQRVFTLYGRKCVKCGNRATQAHHVVPVRTILVHMGETEEGLAMAADARNGAPVCTGCHERHEKAFRRILRHQLPLGCVQWAKDNGFEWVLDRFYPRRPRDHARD